MLITFIFSLIDKLVAFLLKLRGTLYGSHGYKKEIPLTCKLSNGFLFSGLNMSIIARIDQKVTFAPVFKDAAGNQVSELGSVPTWSLSDSTLASIEVSEDGLQATVTPTGNTGVLEVNMVVDADPDADVEELVAKATITFKAGKAAFISLGGTVSDIPVEVVTTAPPVETTTAAPEEQPVTEAPVAEGEVTTAAPEEQQPG